MIVFAFQYALKRQVSTYAMFSFNSKIQNPTAVVLLA